MHLDLIVRRAVVTTGAALSLVAGGLAVRTAAEWAVAASTKVDPSPGIIELQARIEAADVKAAAIRAQIERLAGGSDRLAGMIHLANDLAVNDGAAADALTADLDQAKAALAAAESVPEPTVAPAPVRATAPTTTTARTTTTTTTAAATTTTTRSDDHHDDHRDGGDDD